MQRDHPLEREGPGLAAAASPRARAPRARLDGHGERALRVLPEARPGGVERAPGGGVDGRRGERHGPSLTVLGRGAGDLSARGPGYPRAGFEAPQLPTSEYASRASRSPGTKERLHAEEDRSLLIVLQGIDAAGKDGTVKHVLRGTNPSGVTVRSFKEPSSEEGAHDFLWRYRNYAVARIVAGTLERMDPRYPEPPEDVRAFAERELQQAR